MLLIALVGLAYGGLAATSIASPTDVTVLVDRIAVPLLPPRIPSPSIRVPITVVVYLCAAGEVVESIRGHGYRAFGVEQDSAYVGSWPPAFRHFYMVLPLNSISPNSDSRYKLNSIDISMMAAPGADVVVSLFGASSFRDSAHAGFVRALTSRHPRVIFFSEPLDEAGRFVAETFLKKREVPFAAKSLEYWQGLFCQYSYQLDLEATLAARVMWMDIMSVNKEQHGTPSAWSVLAYQQMSALLVFRPFLADDYLMRPVGGVEERASDQLLANFEAARRRLVPLCWVCSGNISNDVCMNGDPDAQVSAWDLLRVAIEREIDAEKDLVASYSSPTKHSHNIDVCSNLIASSVGLKEGGVDMFGIRPDYKANDENTHYDDVETGGLSYQLDVYLYAKRFMHERGLKRVVDVGCGNGYKLVHVLGEFDTTGVDTDPAYSHLVRSYPTRKWLRSGEPEKSFASYNLSADLVISSDVIEHIRNPDDLLDFIDSIDAPFVILSTPDRIGMQAFPRFASITGPSGNPWHIREWTYGEFRRYLSRRYDVLFHAVTVQERHCQFALVTKRTGPRLPYTKPVPSYFPLTPGVSVIASIFNSGPRADEDSVQVRYGDDIPTAITRYLSIVLAGRKASGEIIPDEAVARTSGSYRWYLQAVMRDRIADDIRAWMLPDVPATVVPVAVSFCDNDIAPSCPSPEPTAMLHWPVSGKNTSKESLDIEVRSH